MPTNGWIGVDLDGTLAMHGYGLAHVGPPVPLMLERVKQWLEAGIEVRICTARAGDPDQVPIVRAWLLEHLGRELPITNRKDFAMVELWDDRAVQVHMNTGERADGLP